MVTKLIKKYWYFAGLSFIFSAIQVFSMLYQPDVIADLLNAIQSNPEADMTLITRYGILLISVGLLGLVAGIINTVLGANLAQRIGADIREEGFKKIQSYSYTEVEKMDPGNLVVRLTNDVTMIQNAIMMGFQVLLRVPLIFFGALILAMTTLPFAWWTIILYIVLVVLLNALIIKRLFKRFTEIQEEKDHLNKIVKENMDGVRVVKSFVTEEKEKKRYFKGVDNLMDNFIKVGQTFSIMIPAYVLIANLVIAFAIYAVAGRAINDFALIGNVTAFISYVMQIMFALVMGGFVSQAVFQAVPSAKRINEIMDIDPTANFGDKVIKSVDEIKFENVSFRYPNSDEDTLKDISFTIKKGQKIGIVGSTGSGKTTLVNLIPRLYDPSEGSISINGIDYREYKHSEIVKNISIVLQKANLFSGTIRDNILHGNKNASDKDLERAAKFAQAHEFIVKKEGQYGGEVYQKGANFSGGQKQRLSIARGLIKDPSILILDDSTSALDARSENLVKKAINEELNDTTVIMVAQKIASVIDSDYIVVLDDGKVDAIGTHKELVKTSSVYQEIYETQKAKEVN